MELSHIPSKFKSLSIMDRTRFGFFGCDGGGFVGGGVVGIVVGGFGGSRFFCGGLDAGRYLGVCCGEAR